MAKKEPVYLVEPHCEVCNRPTTELFEILRGDHYVWAGKCCRSVRYVSYDKPTEHTKTPTRILNVSAVSVVTD